MYLPYLSSVQLAELNLSEMILVYHLYLFLYLFTEIQAGHNMYVRPSFYIPPNNF
jgi:hypothetical protein